MKKQNIYVQIDSFDEFEKFRKVLNSLGFRVWGGYGGVPFDKYLRFDYHKRLGVHSTNLGFEKITFGQLIDLLNEPKKIAVRVENEKEFKALMKYYDSLGWKSWNDHDIERSHNAGEAIDFHDNYRSAIIEIQEMDRYQIIPFSEFAEKHNIKLPLITSEDGVDLYEDSDIHIVWKDGSGWEFDNSHKGFKSDDGGWYVNPEIVQPERKIFSTKQAALDWIEAQKPKEIQYVSEFGIKCQITKEETLLNCSCGCFSITKKDIEEINKALKEIEK